ncbi:MAG TPA: calcium-binding protein [Coleofasciculaceae cyanobacterium]|jgi:hypothetical protein
MRILITRNVIYNYLLNSRSLRSILSIYLFKKIQREPQLQGFLTETTFQEVLLNIASSKKTQAEQEQCINFIKQTLQLLPTCKVNENLCHLNGIEIEEISCALQNGLDALITHDPAHYEFATSFLVWTVGEFLNQYRRSKLNRNHLESSIESSLHFLIDRAVPIWDSGTEFLFFYGSGEPILQELKASSYFLDEQDLAIGAHPVVFGNEFQFPLEVHSQQLDSLLNGFAETRRTEHESSRNVRKKIRVHSRVSTEKSLEAKIKLYKAEAAQARLKFFEDNLTSILTFLTVVVGFQLISRSELVSVLEQQLRLELSPLNTETSIAAISSDFYLSLFNYLYSNLDAALFGDLDFKQDVYQFFSTDDQLQAVSHFFNQFIEVVENIAVQATKGEALESFEKSLFTYLYENSNDFYVSDFSSEEHAVKNDQEISHIKNEGEIDQNVASTVFEVEYLVVENTENNLFIDQDIVNFSQDREQGGDENESSFEVALITPSETDQVGPSDGPFSLGSSSLVRARVYGTDGDDLLIVPTPDSVYFNGNSGNDTIVSGSGNDFLNGGQGDDTLTGGAGADIFMIGYGMEAITDFNAAEGDRIEIIGEMSDYRFASVGVGTEIRVGSPKVARLLDVSVGQPLAVVSNTSKQALNFVFSPVSSPLVGKSEDDRLIGNTGSNWLRGESGNDILMGGRGQFATEFNLLEGGEGADTFVLGNSSGAFHTAGGFSTIVDFNASQGDKIQLSGNSNSYTFRVVGFNTEIRMGAFQLYGDELIGVVKNETNLNSSTDIKFT